MAKKFSYHTSVDYSLADPMKVLAQQEAKTTAQNLPFGFKEVEGSRGESAYVFDMGEHYGALIQEGLGTKSLVAQAVYAKTGKSYFAAVAQDTVAAIINDLISVGATPVALSAYWSSSSYDWLADKQLATDFITGWRDACNKAGVSWGGGETQSLPDVIEKGALELAGSAFGIIKDKKHLVNGKNLDGGNNKHSGDVIVLIESSGPHANGISLIRQIADQLPEGYQTKLPSGETLGEAVLKPTHLYSALVLALQEAGVDIHYLSNITGHGWRKLMRADVEFSYVMHQVPPAVPIFDFIAEKSGNSLAEMYGNYNMGAGYAVYVPAEQSLKVVEIAKNCGFKAWTAGAVELGTKKVLITDMVVGPISFTADSLGVR